MVKVQVRRTGPKLFQVQIDQHELKFDGDGLATIEVSDSSFHLIRWFVMGPKGTTYSVAIVKPTFVNWRHEAALDKDKQDAGKDWFSVKA